VSQTSFVTGVRPVKANERRAKMRRAISLTFLLALASIALGQEAGFVDTRPGSQPEPHVTGGSADGGGMGCGGCVIVAPLKIEIQRLTLIDRQPFPLVEWTVRVTNQTKAPIRLPSSLSWSDLSEEVGVDRRQVQRLHLRQTAECGASGDKPASKRRAGVSMYGAPDGKRDVMTLDAGQWMTVIGTGAGCSFPRGGFDSYAVSLQLSQVEWYREKNEDRENSRSVYSMIASEPVKWDGARDFVAGQIPK